jgi:xanthine/CO dehydrogenase XdhC/CoxF family maturation factor
MDTNHIVLQELLAAQEAGEAVVLATVVKARGSVPRHAGTKMVVYEGGRTSGTIGGGEMEARVIAEAKEALADGQTRVVPSPPSCRYSSCGQGPAIPGGAHGVCGQFGIGCP